MNTTQTQIRKGSDSPLTRACWKLIKNFFKTKKELPKEEPVCPKPDESGQVTVIINEMIYDNILVHEKIKDWIDGRRIVTSNFNDLEKDISHTEYFLNVISNETFVEDHKHVILHCTIPEYLLREMMKK